jgi:hypothetical protein
MGNDFVAKSRTLQGIAAFGFERVAMAAASPGKKQAVPAGRPR